MLEWTWLMCYESLWCVACDV